MSGDIHTSQAKAERPVSLQVGFLTDSCYCFHFFDTVFECVYKINKNLHGRCLHWLIIIFYTFIAYLNYCFIFLLFTIF